MTEVLFLSVSQVAWLFAVMRNGKDCKSGAAAQRPRALAGFGVFTSLLLVAVPMVSLLYPQYQTPLKALLLTGLVAELATALWLLIKGLPSEPHAISPA